jgi:hypothetical protein
MSIPGRTQNFVVFLSNESGGDHVSVSLKPCASVKYRSLTMVTRPWKLNWR